MLPCVIGPLCPPAALEQLIALAGPKSVFSSIFPLGCLVNEQLGNNNPRASLHPFYTSNRLFFFFFFQQQTELLQRRRVPEHRSFSGRHLAAGRRGPRAAAVPVAGGQWPSGRS